MKLLLQSTAAILIFAEASCFAPAPSLASSKMSALEAARESNNCVVADSMKAFGVAATIFAFNFATPIKAEARDFFGGSSVQVAETIKTMDFSLPSSYDSISDVKKSSVDALTQEENLLTGTVVKKVPKATTEKIGFTPKQTEEEKKVQKEAAEATKKAEKEAADAQRAAKELERKAEAKAKAAANALAAKEKATQKESQKEAKAKAEAAKAEAAKEKQYSGVDFVDTGLPSYGDSTTKSGKRSAFSI